MQNSTADLLKPFLLEDKVVLVTGTSSGFGRHFAHVLAAAGARVALGARRLERVAAEAHEITASGGSALAVRLDVTDSASIASALDSVEAAFGVASVVINNAGITIPRPLVDLSDDDWRGA